MMLAPASTFTTDASLDRAFMHQRTLFGTSATMVGVCLTAVSLILVVERLSSIRSFSRVAIGADSLVFLSAAIMSFCSMRAQVRGQPSRLGDAAEVVMLVGLVITAVVCLTLVLTLA